MSESSTPSVPVPALPPPHLAPFVPRQPNLPCQDLLASREDYVEICVPLYEASVTGDWEAAKAILDKRPELVRFAITDNCDTALHVSASTEENKLTESFVKNLVRLMTKEDMELQNMNHNTAFFSAATAGNAKMCATMKYKNRILSEIPSSSGMMPLYNSALMGKYSTVKYLYNNSCKMSGHYFWTGENRGWVLVRCVECGFFGFEQLLLRLASVGAGPEDVGAFG